MTGLFQKAFFLLFMVCIVIVFYCLHLAHNGTYVVLQSINELRRGRTRLTRSKPVYLSVDFVGAGLGNMMFQYASLYGIAKHGHRIPLVPERVPLRQHFLITADNGLQISPGEEWGKVVEFHASRYDETIVKVAEKSNAHLELIGYFQSWMYFRDAFSDIRREFRFNSNVSSLAKQFLRDLGIRPSDNQAKRSTKNDNVTVIGIHVRRGDLLSGELQTFGYSVPDEAYIERAMRYFEWHFAGFKEIHFLVVSNDIDWCLEKIRAEGRRVTFSRENDAIVDMALLASCDHVIMTVGTFGWWGGWLAGGRVVYYKDFPRRGSPLERSFSLTKHDYFLPDWAGM